MSEAVKQFIQKTDWMKTITGCTILMVFTFQAIILMFFEIPDNNESLVHTLFGMVDAGMMGIVQYYFGSSKGSQDKQEIIKAQNEKLTS